MIYLSGTSNAAVREYAKRTGRLGLMATPLTGYMPQVGEFPVWAADNGCYSQGERFDTLTFLSWLGQLRDHRERCLFAVAPDVVGDARATWKRSRLVLPIMRAMGYKAALVAQDGIQDTRIEWEAFDCLFMGGSTEFKVSETAYQLMQEARARGKWCHMGRVNTWRRLRAAAVSGYDSVDGTYLAFGPDRNMPTLQGWLEQLHTQGRFIA